MADDSRSTQSPAYVWFAEHGERKLDVMEFRVEEAISSPFSVIVTASSPDATLRPASFVGKGAAFRFAYRSGEQVWAGICSKAALIATQPNGATTVSVYQFVIAPAPWRTKLRRNSRIFQQMTVPEIVSKILDEWEIPHTKDLIKEPHLKHEYRVQYNETDFAFLSRLLEEEGISYFFDHAPKSGQGSKVTSVIFADKPESEPPVGLTLPHRHTGHHKTFADGENVIFDLAITNEMRFGTATIGDFDMRLQPHMELLEKARAEGAVPEELVYEDYQYLPGAFRALPGTGDATPIADDKGAVRTIAQQRELRAKREIGAARSGGTIVSFQTTALDLTTGNVFAVGQNSSEVHPNAVVAQDRKLLVIGRRLEGTIQDIRHQAVHAVPANVPHRPVHRTPKPRIAGVQSALVSGPKNQEIHTDELGRVRVQFGWDREHAYDDKSSCWMRVSQGWAGSSYGLVTIPRVGQEVLVAFYEGDPDRPVIVGRVYNMTNGVPYELAKNKTKSGWRTESSGGDGRSRSARGFNELMFEDAIGREHVSIRAESCLSTLVKNAESRDIGASRTTRIGKNDSTHVGKVALTLVGEHTGLLLSESGTPEVIFSTGGATMRLAGKNIMFDAKGEIHLHGGTKLEISTASDAVFVKGADVKIDCEGKQGPVPSPVHTPAASPPGGGPQLPPPYDPQGTLALLPPPGGFPEVEVKDPNAPEEGAAAPAQQGSRLPSAASDERAALGGSPLGGTNTIGAVGNPASLGSSLGSLSNAARLAGTAATAASTGGLAGAASLAGQVASLVPGLGQVAQVASLAGSAAQLASGAGGLAGAASLAGHAASLVPGLGQVAQAVSLGQSVASLASGGGLQAAAGLAGQVMGPQMSPVLSQGLALAAGKSPLAVVQSLGTAELQKAFMSSELASVPMQNVAKLTSVAQQVVGYVDLKDKAMVLLKGWG